MRTLLKTAVAIFAAAWFAVSIIEGIGGGDSVNEYLTLGVLYAIWYEVLK